MERRDYPSAEIPTALRSLLKKCGYAQVAPFGNAESPERGAHFSRTDGELVFRWILEDDGRRIKARTIHLDKPVVSFDTTHTVKTTEIERIEEELKPYESYTSAAFLLTELKAAKMFPTVQLSPNISGRTLKDGSGRRNNRLKRNKDRARAFGKST